MKEQFADVEGSTVKITGLPEAPPVAARMYFAPVPGTITLSVNVMVCVVKVEAPEAAMGPKEATRMATGMRYFIERMGLRFVFMKTI